MGTERTIRVGLVQGSPPASPDDILDSARGWVSRAAEGGAQLVVFPELFFPGFYGLLEARRQRSASALARFFALAEPIPGPVTDAIGSIARAHGTHVVFTLLERGTNTKEIHNSSVLIGPNGDILHHHRKTMLTPELEHPGFTPGDKYEVVSSPLGRIGLLICADATCPEGARLLALRGAELVCLSSGDFRSWWRVEGHDLVELIWTHCSAAPTRAIDNNIFWLAANLAGVQAETVFFGGSRVISPLGQVIAQGGWGPDARELVVADLDLSVRERVAATFSLLGRRRPELYGDLARGVSDSPA